MTYYVRMHPVFKHIQGHEPVAILRKRPIETYEYYPLKRAALAADGRLYIHGNNRLMQRLVRWGLVVKEAIVDNVEGESPTPGARHRYYLTGLGRLTVMINEKMTDAEWDEEVIDEDVEEEIDQAG